MAKTAAELDLDHLHGLTEAEAARRHAEEGANELQQQKPRPFWKIALGVCKEPMFLLLIACVVLCFILQDFTEAGMLLFFVLFIIGITIFQERKTERALDALRDLSAPRALVVRGGKQITVPGREVVRGDTVLLKEGDRVAADIIVTWASNLSADESLLTGESVPVRKSSLVDHIRHTSAGDASSTPTGEDASVEPDVSGHKMGAPGGDDLPYTFSGSMIVGGKGVGIVKTIGTETSLGRIGKSLASLKEEKTPLERETNRLVLIMAVVGVSIALVVFLYYGLQIKKWLDGALAAITLAMGLLPEEFPVILTVFLSLGAWRISKSQVLTRRNSAIETLGACTVLCTDKTGTLTLNQMMVQALWDMNSGHTFQFRDPSDGEERVDEECHEVVEYAILSSQRDPFDPMETALWRLSQRHQVDDAHTHLQWDLLREYPLSRELLATSRVYSTGQVGSSSHVVAAVKGAPEAVADLCHLEAAPTARVLSVASEFAGMGLRVLGVARCLVPLPESGGDSKEPTAAALPPIQHDFPFEFVGLVAFVDPIRPTVPAAVQAAYKAGIRVVMITGDYPATARAIAAKIGLEPHNPKVITGPELDAMPDDELMRQVREKPGVSIFARVVPEQKLKIVQAFKAAGEIVAMTGDGVNDAPALKASHIGVAMGMRGTDVAREAAHLVLLDDDFSSIVRAVRLGRRIFDNLRKAMAYVISIHVPLAGVVLFPVLLWGAECFKAVHIVFLELVIDPACSVVLEAEQEEKGVMERPPRNVRKSMISIPAAILAGLQGAILLVAALLASYYSRQWGGWTENQARALAFGTVIIGNLGLIVEGRSWESWLGAVLARPNKPMWIVFAIVIPVLFFVLYTPGVIKLFSFDPMPGVGIPIFIGLGLASTLWFEFFKLGYGYYMRRQGRKANIFAVEMESVQTASVDADIVQCS